VCVCVCVCVCTCHSVLEAAVMTAVYLCGSMEGYF